jgi:hypothetical protein
LQVALKPRNTLSDFEDLASHKRLDKVIRRAYRDMDGRRRQHYFKLSRAKARASLRERWTTVYPDPNSTAYPVYLKINGTTIKELTFISMDGGRIFVPMAGVRLDAAGPPEYFWNAKQP